MDAAGSIDIGLYPDVIFLSLELVLFWQFSIQVALLPVESDRLRRLERGSAVVRAVCFSMFADTPSHPVDLLVSRAINSLYTDSSVENRCFGQLSHGKFGSAVIGNSDNGGKL